MRDRELEEIRAMILEATLREFISSVAEACTAPSRQRSLRVRKALLRAFDSYYELPQTVERFAVEKWGEA